MHGNRVSQNVAKTVLQDVGYQCWVQFGHVHRLDAFIKRGEDFQVGAVASGCLCLYPHYHRGRMTSKWQQGTAIMEVDLNSRFVKIENLLFERDQDKVWVRFERKLFTSGGA
jgi:hypothetical protein